MGQGIKRTRINKRMAKQKKAVSVSAQAVHVLFEVMRQAGWTHEIWHLLAARLLGIPIQAQPDRVYFTHVSSKWKNLAIVLAPFTISTLLFFGLLRMVNAGLDRGWLWPAFFYWGSCIWDVRDSLHYLWTGKWPKNQMTFADMIQAKFRQ